MSNVRIPSMTHLLDNTHKRRAIRNLYKMISEGGGSGGGGATPIQTSELKTLRDNGQLTPGALYRITDYVTKTAQTVINSVTFSEIQIDVRSLEYPFDIVVMAITEDTLSEDAWAAHSERDTEGYFANSNLANWKLKYCIDNDTDRFAWADTTNGKGVIYRLTDEYNNSLPYDFKNIQFKLPLDHYNKVFSESYYADSVQCTPRWCHAFNYCDGGMYDDINTVPCIDASLNTTILVVRNNYVGDYINSSFKLEIPLICLNTSKVYYVDTPAYIGSNYIGDLCNDIIAQVCTDAHIYSGCSGITFIGDHNWAVLDGNGNQLMGCPISSSGGGRT